MPDTQTLITCGFAGAGLAALLGSYARHVIQTRRRKAENTARATSEREKFHTVAAMMRDVSAMVLEASQRAEDKLASLERVLRQAEQRAARLETALEADARPSLKLVPGEKKTA